MFLPSIPFLWRVYSIVSNQALSYAFCTSRNVIYAVFLFFLLLLGWLPWVLSGGQQLSFRVFLPPLFVVPFWFFHLWSSRRLFQHCLPMLCLFRLSTFLWCLSLCIVLLFHLLPKPGWFFSASCAFYIMAFNIFLVSGVPSMNTSFAILSGPRLFSFSVFLLRCWIPLYLSHYCQLRSAGVLAPGALFQLLFWSIYCILGCLLWLGITLQSS